MEFLNKVFFPISDSSKKLYTRNLMKLNNEQPITNFNFLKEPKQILNMIKDYKPTTQRSYIIATSAGARAMHGFGAEVWYTIVS